MKNLADAIESFIIGELLREHEDTVLVQRNELAERLSCAPSQISYVLSTRFTPERGFMVELIIVIAIMAAVLYALYVCSLRQKHPSRLQHCSWCSICCSRKWLQQGKALYCSICCRLSTPMRIRRRKYCSRL